MDTEPAIQAAMSKLGTAYVWGASGPNNFDCSGLVQWAFGQAGIKVSRTTYTQVLEGQPVNGSPQRGDLVFPDAGHVMIALGGDKAIHAPETGDVVKISTYWTKPVAIRRLGTNSGQVGDVATNPNYQANGASPNLGDLIPNYSNSAGISDELSQLEQAVGGINGYIKNLNGIIKAMSMLFVILTSEEGWLRILKVIGGTALVLSGSANMMLQAAKAI